MLENAVGHGAWPLPAGSGGALRLSDQQAAAWRISWARIGIGLAFGVYATGRWAAIPGGHSSEDGCQAPRASIKWGDIDLCTPLFGHLLQFLFPRETTIHDPAHTRRVS